MFQVVITSTIFPQSNTPELVKSVFSPVDRLSQTIETIESLKQIGYNKILLADNSGVEYLSTLKNTFNDVDIRCYSQYQFKNKGISECFLLIAALENVPDDVPILKISGRYKLTKRINFDYTNYDVAAKIYRHKKSFFFKRTMATRCYMFKNKKLYLLYLNGILEEMFAYSFRIKGAGSLKRFLVNQFVPNVNQYSYLNPILSVEAASLKIINRMKLRLQTLDKIGLIGLAGTFNDLVIED